MADNEYFRKKRKEYTKRDKQLGITRLGVRVPKERSGEIQEIAQAMRDGRKVLYKISKRKVSALARTSGEATTKAD